MLIQDIKPLLFMPSPRDIPSVKKLWHVLPYDKFIVKYKRQLEAYTEGKEFFMNNLEYTHFVLCPDDLEVHPIDLEILLKNIAEHEYETISGICNIDESQENTFAIHPLGVNIELEKPPVQKGQYFMLNEKPFLPQNQIIQVGATGFPCQIISRDLMSKISWKGATNGGLGNFDWQFSKDCTKLGVPIMANTEVYMYHRRFEQSERVMEFVRNPKLQRHGYSVFLPYT